MSGLQLSPVTEIRRNQQVWLGKNIPPLSTKIRVNEELPHKATLQYNIQIFQIGY